MGVLKSGSRGNVKTFYIILHDNAHCPSAMLGAGWGHDGAVLHGGDDGPCPGWGRAGRPARARACDPDRAFWRALPVAARLPGPAVRGLAPPDPRSGDNPRPGRRGPILVGHRSALRGTDGRCARARWRGALRALRAADARGYGAAFQHRAGGIPVMAAGGDPVRRCRGLAGCGGGAAGLLDHLG